MESDFDSVTKLLAEASRLRIPNDDPIIAALNAKRMEAEVWNKHATEILETSTGSTLEVLRFVNTQTISLPQSITMAWLSFYRKLGDDSKGKAVSLVIFTSLAKHINLAELWLEYYNRCCSFVSLSFILSFR